MFIAKPWMWDVASNTKPVMVTETPPNPWIADIIVVESLITRGSLIDSYVVAIRNGA